MSDEPQVMSTGDRLIYMANQIARNFAALGEASATAETATHIRLYWDPGMRARIRALAAEKPDALSPTAAAAIHRLDSAGDTSS